MEMMPNNSLHRADAPWSRGPFCTTDEEKKAL